MKIAVFGLLMRRGGRRMFQLLEVLVEQVVEHLVEPSQPDLAANLAAAARPSTPEGVGPKALDGLRLAAARLALRSAGQNRAAHRERHRRFRAGLLQARKPNPRANSRLLRDPSWRQGSAGSDGEPDAPSIPSGGRPGSTSLGGQRAGSGWLRRSGSHCQARRPGFVFGQCLRG